MKSDVEFRDLDGIFSGTKQGFAPHHYGYKRLKELAAERKKYNIDKFNKYRGGVPMPGLGSARAGAMAAPGEKVDSIQLDFRERYHG
eukprot:CAMPEP_0201283056 /NCGR_PEP_ID=MMETSP1317-20130820/7454_1 /ASSEMBLY_ACC=CAM_ASM_000770 /TAXON_ID=187299 /ORGANISM="Undescribed Undescribed, Strain Undescribed" /LENGTH=86 /DNA_ID=CAMNT_0047597913 /DNA_START=194 /DNA_END=454 /DNA_ORIENTATION=-